MPFNLMASIGLDGSRFAAGMHQVEKQVEHLGHSINHIGGHHLSSMFAGLFGFAALEQATHKTIEYGAHVFDMSRRVDVSREELQKWDYALTQNGSNLEAGVGFLEKLGVARKKALEGSEEQIEAFKELGVTIDDLKSKRLQEIAIKIGDAVKEGDAQKLIASLRAVGGKAAGELVATFKTGLEELFSEADHLGVIMSDETITQLKQAEDEIANLAKQMRNILAPAIVFVTDTMGKMIDLGKIVFGGWGAAIGNFMETGSFGDAVEAFQDNAREVVDDRIQRDAEFKKKAAQKQLEGGDEETVNKEALKHAREQLKLKEKLAEITRKNNLAELNATERLKELEKERAEITERIGPPTMEEAIKAEELRGEINREKKHKNLPIEVDELAKVGGFVGLAANQNPILQVAQQSLEVQRRIEQNTHPFYATNQGF